MKRSSCIVAIIFTGVVISSCDSSTTRGPTTKSGKINTPTSNTNTSIDFSTLKTNVTSKLTMVNVNMTTAYVQQSITNDAVKRFNKGCFPCDNNSVSNVSYGDLLSLDGGLLRQNNQMHVIVQDHSHSTVDILNTFTGYGEMWYNYGAPVTYMNTPYDMCNDQRTVSTSMLLRIYTKKDGRYDYSFNDDLWSYQAIKNIANQFTSNYAVNKGSDMTFVTFYMDAMVGMDIKQPDNVCDYAPLLSSDQVLPYGIDKNNAINADARSNTDFEPEVTHANIIEYYVKPANKAKDHCADNMTKVRRIISHEAGHFLITLADLKGDASLLMNEVTDCSATTALPILVNNRPINVFNETPTPNTSLRWIP